MAIVSRQTPWWWRILKLFPESACCLFANPRCYSLELECGWCGRVIDVRELERIEQKKMRITLKLWFWR